MEFTGTVIAIWKKEVVGEKDLAKQELVLENPQMYFETYYQISEW